MRLGRARPAYCADCPSHPARACPGVRDACDASEMRCAGEKELVERVGTSRGTLACRFVPAMPLLMPLSPVPTCRVLVPHTSLDETQGGVARYADLDPPHPSFIVLRRRRLSIEESLACFRSKLTLSSSPTAPQTSAAHRPASRPLASSTAATTAASAAASSAGSTRSAMSSSTRTRCSTPRASCNGRATAASRSSASGSSCAPAARTARARAARAPSRSRPPSRRSAPTTSAWAALLIASLGRGTGAPSDHACPQCPDSRIFVTATMRYPRRLSFSLLSFFNKTRFLPK